MPCQLQLVSTRIHFLSMKLHEAAQANIGQSGSLREHPEVQAWAMEVLERDDDGMEQSLFSLHLLYDSIVGSVSNDILNSDELDSQARIKKPESHRNSYFKFKI